MEGGFRRHGEGVVGRLAAAEQGIAEDQRRIAAELTELPNRVTAIEKLVREVG